MKQKKKTVNTSLTRLKSIHDEIEIAIDELELFLNHPEEIMDDGDYITCILERMKRIDKYVKAIK